MTSGLRKFTDYFNCSWSPPPTKLGKLTILPCFIVVFCIMTSQEKTEEHPFADIFDEDETERNFLLSKPVCFVVFGKPVSYLLLFGIIFFLFLKSQFSKLPYKNKKHILCSFFERLISFHYMT